MHGLKRVFLKNPSYAAVTARKPFGGSGVAIAHSAMAPCFALSYGEAGAGTLYCLILPGKLLPQGHNGRR